jgi:hypothetical protein
LPFLPKIYGLHPVFQQVKPVSATTMEVIFYFNCKPGLLKHQKSDLLISALSIFVKYHPLRVITTGYGADRRIYEKNK